MARPTTITSRPAARAASATARKRPTWEANVVTATRRGAVRMRSASVFATSDSDGERPSRIALVESPTSASTPSSPSADSLAASVGPPSNGVGSIFQSPVWSTVPAGVRIASAFDSGIEWATLMKSMAKGPIDKCPPSVAEAVDREVHPDLADAAKGCEYQLVLRHAVLARLAERAPLVPLAAYGKGEHIARRYCLDTAVADFKHQAAGLIEANKAAAHFDLAVAHAYRFADTACVAEPVVDNHREAPATIPLRDTAAHCGGQAGKQLLWRYRGAMRPQVGCRETSLAVAGGRMIAAIDADTDDDSEVFFRFSVRGRFALDENTRAFTPVEQ